jgi:hypothetical protein
VRRDADEGPVDLCCASCGYSLRGCDASDQCPECGYPVCTTLAQKVGPRGDIAYAEQLASAAKSVGVPLGAAQLVMRAVQQAILSRSALGYDAGGVRADEISEALLELIDERGGSKSRRQNLLKSMELHACADVGRVVHALMSARLMAMAGETGPIESFEQLDIIQKWLAS